MADVSQSSILKEDPLHAYSGLSLFPRTLKSLSNPLSPSFYQSDDLQHTHTILESMPFEIQNEHQEQAKAILDESSKPLNQEIGTSVASEDTNVGVKVNPIPNKRERRPGLDRKRRQFSLNFTTSQPPPSAPSFDGSKYPNPDDYFAEYDKFENASREWQKQTGINVIDTHQNPPSKRSRRPGIPGRKRATYKHTYTDTYFTDAIDLEASEKENPIPSEQSLERTTAAPLMTADTEVDDSTVDTDKNLQNILSELLACNHDELEGDGAVKLLEDRLQIKSFNVEKLSIPEFQDIREMNLKASGRNPSKRKSVLTDIQNMLKGNRDGVRKNSHSPFSLTEKRFSSSNPPEDQFSFPDIHNLLPGDLLSSEVEDQPRAKDSNICSSSSVTKDAGKNVTNTSPSNVGTVDVASPLNSSVQMSSCDDDSDTHSGIHKFHPSPDGSADNCVDASITNRNSATLEVNLDMQTKGSEGGIPMSESGANRKTGRRASDDDIDEETDTLEMLADYASREVTRIDPFTVERDNIPYQQDASSQSPNRAPEQFNTMDGSFKHAEQVQGQRGEESGKSGTACEIQVESAQEVHNSSQEQTKERRKRGSCDSSKETRSKTVHGESEGDKQMKKTIQHESRAKKQAKRKSNEREEKKRKKTSTRESKMFSRRKSLAGAGTKFESGVRRSTRIKSRPLEYWRGERFLYGRIHESLTTVIGIKYGSPGDGKIEKRATKVKSFVSDEYKELLDFAALH